MLVAVASVASFVDRGWLAPGEPVVAIAWFLVGLWVVALAGTIGRSDGPPPQTSGPTGSAPPYVGSPQGNVGTPPHAGGGSAHR